MPAPITLAYVTSNPQKRAENEILQRSTLDDGTPVEKIVTFTIRAHSVQEELHIDLETLVRAEVLGAYKQLRVPCIVEHAGLIFEGKQFPGGLTKPIWNTLGAAFVERMGMVDRAAIARAVVGYCDGMTIRTFVGETSGRLVYPPRANRDFYWDTVFVPETDLEGARDKTYAEIAAASPEGLATKVHHLSQSSKAMRRLVVYLRTARLPELWSYQ